MELGRLGSPREYDNEIDATAEVFVWTGAQRSGIESHAVKMKHVIVPSIHILLLMGTTCSFLAYERLDLL